MYPNEHLRYTTITWDEYCRLNRDSEILDYVERYRKRKGLPSIRQLVSSAMASKKAVQTILAKAVKSLDEPSRPEAEADRSTAHLDFFETGRNGD